MKKFLAVLVLSIILFTQVGFALAIVEGDACCGGDCGSWTVDGSTVTGKCFCEPKDSSKCERESENGAYVCKAGKTCGACHPAGSVVLCPPSKYTKIEDLIEGITNWIFYIGIVVAPLMIVVGAFMFMTSAGDPAKVQTAKKLIIWTIIGLAIILFSKGLVSLIKFILGA